MTETKTVTIQKLEGRTTLYHWYSGQTEPQRCYLELDCDKATLRADWNSEIGNAVPMDVWNGRTRRYSIPCLNDDAANRLIEELLPLAEQIVAGYELRWDGHNQRGHLSEDAQDAELQLERIVEEWDADESELVRVVDADDYFANSPPLDLVTADTTDEEIKAIAAKVLAESDCDIIEGLESVLESVRQELRNERDEQ